MSDKKIKIFVDGHCFDTEYQGTQTFLRGLYDHLIVNYPQLDIYIGAFYPEKIEKAFPYLGSEKILKYKYHNSLRLLYDIPELIRVQGFEFAHFQNIAPIHKSVCKYIVTLHDILFEDYKDQFPLIYRKSRNFLFRRSFRNAFLKTTVSYYSQQRIACHYSINENDIHILPNAVSTTVYFKNKIEAKKYLEVKYDLGEYILYVSRIEPRKNHSLIIKAWKELDLPDKNIHLVFIGRESIQSAQLAAELRALLPEQINKVHFFDQVSEEELEAFYKACKLFVYPSKAEGFGIPPLEAALYLNPVLCSSSTSMINYDFFHPNFFDPGNYIEFKQKMKDLLYDIPKEEQLKHIAKRIKENYSWEMTAQIFYQLITDKYK
jgi:glycosyltransferase involved in cell wall biosynthesis